MFIRTASKIYNLSNYHEICKEMIDSRVFDRRYEIVLVTYDNGAERRRTIYYSLDSDKCNAMFESIMQGISSNASLLVID